MTALSELLDALHAADEKRWLEARPGVAPDDALRAAWDAETLPDTLIDTTTFAAHFDARSPLYRAAKHALGHRGYDRSGCTCEPPDETLPWQPCVVCCDAIRAACRCPTWTEVSAWDVHVMAPEGR